jgi:hypothetical protein
MNAKASSPTPINKARIMNRPAADYLCRLPEHLVLEGYRGGLSAFSCSNAAGLDDVLALYRGTVGEKSAGPLISTCVDFLGTLGRCAVCHLGFFPAGTMHLCRDEALVLALIAAVQHGDEDAQLAAARGLSCQYRAPALAVSAGTFGLVLKGCGQTLLPVPSDVVDSLIARPAAKGPPPAHRLN